MKLSVWKKQVVIGLGIVNHWCDWFMWTDWLKRCECQVWRVRVRIENGMHSG